MPVTITATRTTSLLIDQDGDGRVDLGDTLFIRLDVANSGDTDALNAVINDALTGQTLVAGSLNISPFAMNDVFNAVGNTQLIVGGVSGFAAGPSATFSGSVLTNDSNLVGDNFPGFTLISTGAFTTSGGGSGSMDANGNFFYNPAAGFSGADTFTYTLRDNGQDGVVGGGDDLVSTAKVTINVGAANGTVWYVDTTKASNGDGTSDNPFNTFANVNGAGGAGDSDSANQVIYAQGAVTADVVMEAGQSLIGTGAALVVGAYTLANAGAANTFNHGSGTGVLLATDNILRGFNVNGTDNIGVGIADNNGSVGNLTISAMNITGSGQAVDIDQGGNLNVALTQLSSTSSSAQGVQLAGTASSGAGLIQGSFTAGSGTIQTSLGAGVLIGAAGGGTASSGGNIAFTYGGDIASPGGSLVDIQDRTGGAVTFNGSLTEGNIISGQTGILIDQNAGTINFNGQMFVSSGGSAGTGVSITNSASGSVAFNAAGNGLDITTANGTAFNWVDGGTLTILGSGNTINATSGRMFVGQNGVIGTNGVTFSAMTSNGNVLTGPAISLNNVDKSGTGTFNGGTVNFQQAITSDALNISNGSSADATFGSFTTAGIGAGSDAIEINASNGVYNFTGAVTINAGAGNGISLVNNTGGSTTLSGGVLNLDTTSGTGLSATHATPGLHALTISGATNSIASTTGRAINVDGVNANITLRDISSNGGTTTGVFLKDTGASGQFVVTGTGSTAGSGGTLNAIGGGDMGSIGAAATGGTGIYLQNVSNVSLANLNFTGAFSNFGIRGENVTNFTLRDSALTGTFGTNEGLDEGAIRFGTENISTGLKGTALFEGNNIAGGFENNLSVFVYGNDSLNMTVQDNATSGDQAIFGLNSNALGDDSLHVESGGTGSNLILLVNGVAFNGARGDQLQTIAIGVTTQNITITNNQFLNGHANIVSGGGGVDLLGGSTATTSNANITYNFSNNTIKGAKGNALDAIYTGHQATISGVIANNTIGTNNGVYEANANGGSSGAAGIDLGHAKSNGAGSINHAVRIEANNLYDIDNGLGAIRLVSNSAGGGTSLLEANVKNNVNGDVGANLLSGLYTIVGGQNAADPSVLGLIVTGNTFRAGAGSGSNAIVLDQLSTNSAAHYNIPGYNNAGTAVRGEFRAGGTASAALSTFWSGSNPTLTNGAFPTFPASKVDAGNAFGITNAAFSLPAPLMAAAVAGQGWEQAAAASQAKAGTIGAAAAAEGVAVTGQAAAATGINRLARIEGALSAPNHERPVANVWLDLPSDASKVAANDYVPTGNGDYVRAGDVGAAAASGKPSGTAQPAASPPKAGGDVGAGGPAIVSLGTAGASPISDDGVLTRAELDWLVEAAIQRWIDAGASDAQVAAMRATKVTTADLSGLTLGKSTPGGIVLDDNAAGHNWYLDRTPGKDEEYAPAGGVLRGAADTVEGSRVDLLTAIMHELGHQIGLEDSYAAADNSALMYGFVNPGERHLPGAEEVAKGTGGPVVTTALALGAVNFGTIEAGTARSISFKTTYDGQGTNRVVTDVSNNSTVTYNNGGGNIVVNSNTQTLGPATALAVDTLAVGNLIYNDANRNGLFDAGDAGVSGVALTLFADANNNGVLDGAEGTTVIASTTSTAGGAYSFGNLAPGDYVVRIDAANFTGGGALAGKLGTFPGATDPDDNVNEDNNGMVNATIILTKPINLTFDQEPTAGPGNDSNLTLDIGVFAPNVAPTFASPSAQPSYTENAPFVVVAPSVTVADSDNVNFAGGSVSIAFTSGATAGDVVGIATSTTPGSGIEINGMTGAVSFNGTVIGTAVSATLVTLNAAATTTAIQALAQAVIFTSMSESPTATPRVLTFTFNDGGGTAGGGASTTSFIRTITVTPVNDAPTVTDSEVFVTTEDASAPAGATVLSLYSGHFADLDNASETVNGIAVAGNAADAGTQGLWQYSTDGGANWFAVGGVSTGAALILNDDAQLRFVPVGNYNGNPPALVAHGLDASYAGGFTAGAARVALDIGVRGGATPISLNGSNIGAIVQAINDAPVNQVPGAQVMNEDGTLAITGLSVGDVDLGGAPITVVLSVTSGKITISENFIAGDVTGNGTATVTIVCQPGLINQEFALPNGVVYTPAAEYSGPVTLTMTSNDGGANGVDPGGPSPTSEQDVDTVAITVNAVDDAPVAVTDAYSTAEDSILTIAAATGLLFNDTDIDGGPKAVASVNGNVAAVGTEITLASGAKVTVNGDGSLSYNPNNAFNYLISQAKATQTGAANSSATDSFSYALNGGSATTVTVTINGVDGPGDQLRGTPGADNITGTDGNDSFRLEQGADDIANGGDGDDGFFFGAAFTAADQVNGGNGNNDQIGLQGGYTGDQALTLGVGGVSNITGVEVIAVLPGFSYNITAINANLAPGGLLTIQATQLGAGDSLTFNGAAETDGGRFILYGGLGNDNFTGGSGDDGFYFGQGRFNSSDIVAGGAGTNDQLGLDGNYGTVATPFELSGSNVSGIELVALLQKTGAPANSFVVSTAQNFVAPGTEMIIWGVLVQTGITFDGAAETDGGKFRIFGGLGADRLVGGAGDDWFHGGAGGDVMIGGSGVDTFAYTAATQSTSINFDTLVGFDDGIDKIDLPGAGTVTGFAAPASGTLTLASFDAELAAGVNAALGPNQAIQFTATAGDMSGRIFAVVDANGDGDYQAGTDYVFEFVAPVSPIDQLGMFI